MSDAAGTGSLQDDEVVIRFVVSKRNIRQDKTVKPEAFMPPKSLDLSVTHVANRSMQAIWERGHAVAKSHAIAAKREIRLIGGAELTSRDVRAAHPLDVVEAPIPEDQWHAHIVGWPPFGEEKERTKMLMILLASRAKYQPFPIPT